MNILITGAYGFIGSNLSSYLAHQLNYQLISLDITCKQIGVYNKFYSWQQIDEIDTNNMDVIIHLAGKAHDTKNTSSEQEYYDINVGLTQKIFQHFLKSAANKFIFFSSVKAVADSIVGVRITEETIPNPQTPYGKSKLIAEKWILEQTLPHGKQVYILRPCMIHGPGNKGNLNLLYKLAQKGLPWPLGAFENRRSFTSIGNLLFVIQQLIERNIEPGTYQMADDEPLSTNAIVRLIADSLDKKAVIWNISPDSIRWIAKVGDKLGLPLNSERLKKLTESYVVSNLKLKIALEIEKMPFSAVEGMKKTFESFRENYTSVNILQ